MHSRTQDCTHTVIQVPMPARTPPCPAMPPPIRPSRGGGRWGSVILGEEVARRVSGEVGHRVGRRVGRVDGGGGRWGGRRGQRRGARRGSRGGRPGGRKWRCGSGECGEKAGEAVDEEGEHASTKVREQGGGSTVSMHTCTHAHVCTPTHSVPPTPSSTSPRVRHACTHTHPYCHVSVRPSDGPAHHLAYFAIVLPVLPCTPAHSRTPVRPSPQPLTPHSIPSLRTPTPSLPDLLPPSPCLLPRQICANVRAFTIFGTPSLPPLTWPSCPISSCMHAITNTHAPTSLRPCPTRPACTLPLVPHARTGRLPFCFVFL